MKWTRLTAVIAAAVLLAAAGGAQANNLVVTNAMVRRSTTNTAKVRFDIAWENSWRYTNVNHDAAWVFFKVQKTGDVTNNWQHLTLEGTGTNPPGYSTGTGTGIELIVPDDRMGLFVRRSAEGAGPVSVQNVQAAWNFATNGLSYTNTVRVQVLAVEMVYAAEGSFWLGDGITNITVGTDNDVGGHFQAGTNTIPFAITNEGYEIELGGTNAWSLGNYNKLGMNGGDDWDRTTIKTNPAAYPHGYAAFYCMKYMITQGQYRDFLNTLNRTQQTNRVISVVSTNFAMSGTAAIYYRSCIRCPLVIPGAPTNIVFGCDGNTNMVFNETDDGMDVACNYLGWLDGCAFADWAGLRPMSEMEFVKACRGPAAPVTNEFAWGNTNISVTTGLLNAGMGTETAIGGNCNYNTNLFALARYPYRVGIYATGSSTREEAGASYWGIMELSGTLWQKAVSVSRPEGRNFTGLHGDGVLTAAGAADVSFWPTGEPGAGLVSGCFDDGNYEGAAERTSTRVLLQCWWALGRFGNGGWRVVRTAPIGVGP